MTGFKLTSFVRHGFSQNNDTFTTFYNDLRAYSLISHRYAIANRLVVGVSEGNRPERFNLTGFNGVRGFNDRNHRGDRKVLTTTELRFPFIDHLRMAFPLPIWLGNVRGSVFTDVGTVWFQDEGFQGMHHGRLRDITLGYGFGPRINLGFFVLQFDVAWTSDFVQNSKPSYYFTINQDF
jgi:outer membrane protein assembly factor BamA